MVGVESIQRNAIINRQADFWLLGGASLVVWLLFLLFDQPGASPEVRNHFANIPMTFSVLTLICNNPHFIVSYRIAYSRGFKFILQNWFCLLVLPLILTSFMALGALFYHTPIAGGLGLSTFFYLFFSSSLQKLSVSSVGVQVLESTTALMFLTVGWHYAKQVFGCMMVYSRYDNYPISKAQTRWIKLGVFAVAVQVFFYMADGANMTMDIFLVYGLSLEFGSLFNSILVIGTWVAVALSVYMVFFKNWADKKVLPSANMIVPYVAFLFWWSIPLRINPFYAIVVPFFHSLQYLPFAYKVEQRNFKERPSWIFTANILGILLVSFIAFQGLPSYLDRIYMSGGETPIAFFIVMFSNIINIHHYFIDSVIWKMNQKEVREALLENV